MSPKLQRPRLAAAQKHTRRLLDPSAEQR
jgi:ketosteroid isomerase-like protein